eukprot:5911949-Amphidinium_carterae.1
MSDDRCQVLVAPRWFQPEDLDITLYIPASHWLLHLHVMSCVSGCRSVSLVSARLCQAPGCSVCQGQESTANVCAATAAPEIECIKKEAGMSPPERGHTLTKKNIDLGGSLTRYSDVPCQELTCQSIEVCAQTSACYG